MASNVIDRLDGLSAAAAIKGPCRTATTGNIELYGHQTVGGVPVVTGDRVLVKDQTASYENGIYVADTGQWRRARDFDKTRDVVTGTQVYVTNGSTNGERWFGVISANPVVVGVTAIEFSVSDNLAAIERIYLGAFAVAPTTDLVGNPLIVGAQYFNTVSNSLLTWNGIVWVPVAVVNTSAPNDLSATFAPRAIIDKLNDYVSIFDFPGATAERAKALSAQDWAPIIELAGKACSTARRALFFPSLHDTAGNPIPYMLRSISPTSIGTGAANSVAIKGNHIHWVGEPGVRVKADATAFDGLTITNLFGFITDPFPAGGIGSYWGVFDLFVDTTDVQSTGSGVNVWDFYGYDRFEGRLFGDAGVTTPSGDNIGAGGTDTFVSPHSSNHGDLWLWMRGFYDAGYYGSGNNDGGNVNDKIGSYCKIRGYAERCGIAVTAKRDLWNIEVCSFSTWECAGGIQASPADGLNNHGKVWDIHDVDLRKTQGWPILAAGGKKTLIGLVRIVDFALRISDQAYTAVSQFNWIAAIGFYGETDPQVSSGYAIGYEAWTPPGSPLANREPHAFVLGTNLVLAANLGTSGAVIGAGRIDRVYRAVIETAESSNNMVTDYVPTGVTADDLIQSGTTIVRRKLLKGARGYNPPSIAAAGRDLQTVTVTGARVGDFVEHLSFDLDLQGLFLNGWVSAANTVAFQFYNPTTGAIDLGAGNIRAEVRPK